LAQPSISLGGFFLLHDGDAELIELGRINLRGRVGHEVLGGGGFGKGDDFAQGFFAAEKHGDAVDAERDAAVRRRAVGERIEKETEAAAKLLFGQAERLKKPLLNILAVNPDAAGAEFIAVEHEVVALRANFPRRGFELVEVLVHDACEGMLRADPGFVRLAPLKERESGDPQEFPLRPEWSESDKAWVSAQHPFTGIVDE